MLNGNLVKCMCASAERKQADWLAGSGGSLKVAKGVILDGVVHILNTSPSELAIQLASETLTASDY